MDSKNELKNEIKAVAYQNMEKCVADDLIAMLDDLLVLCEGNSDCTIGKDLRVCEVVASASDPLERKSLIDLGFKEMPHFTVAHSLMYPLGRHIHLSVGCVGTPNEMLWICETDDQNDKSITEIICLHNYDYDGYLTIKKVIAIINSILCKSHF